MDIYEEINKKLKWYQRITLCYRQEFGELAIIKTRFCHCEKAPLYKKCPDDKYILKIHHIPFGKQKLRTIKISSESCLVIFDGYVNIFADEINYDVSYRDGLKILESKYPHYSNEAFKYIKEHYPNYLLCKV